MKSPFTTTITKMSSLCTLVEDKGIAPEELFAKSGIDPNLLESPDNRLTMDQVHQLTQTALKLTGDEFIGLHQGEAFSSLSNILGYVMMNCPDIEEALNKYVRYQKIVEEIMRTYLISEDDKPIRIELTCRAQKVSKSLTVLRQVRFNPLFKKPGQLARNLL
jgi:hypothetical protein